MKLLYFIGASVALWCMASAKEITLDTVDADLQLDTDELVVTRRGGDSHVYQFPNPALRVTDGTTVSLFGVMTSGDFTLHLLPLEDPLKSKPFTLTKTSKGWDVEYLSVSRHYEDSFDIPKDKYVWFIIERTNNYLALYRVPDTNRVLMVSNNVLKKKVNFNKLQNFRASSTEVAFWDFLGFKYDQTGGGGGSKYPCLDAFLEKLKENYKIAAEPVKRCEFAIKSSETGTHAKHEQMSLTLYADIHCREAKEFLQVKDMVVRYRALLLATGITLPAMPTDEQCKKYIIKYRSMRL